MRKLLSFVIGLGAGISLGMLVVALFSPMTGEEFRANLKGHYQDAVEAGRKASAQRRSELEAELKRMREA